MKYSYLIFIFSVLLLSSCTNSKETAPVVSTTGSTAGYILQDIPGSATIKKAEKRDANGALLEEGQFLDNQKTGTWISFHADKGLPSKVISYANNVYNGQYIELNNRGQISLLCSYKNNKLHGEYGKYKFGRTTEKGTYKDGKLDGTYRSYFSNSDKLQKEVEYKDGVQDGYFRQYNEEGAMTIEYVYKNGEVVSGGMVEK